MNHVRFMFNRIKDYTLLYETIPSTVDLFGTPCMEEKNYIKTYCKKIITDVSQKLQPMASVNYLGCIGRIANEVYILEIQNGKYTISLTIDTFHKNATRLTVDIFPEYQMNDMGKRADLYLEKLKIELKNRIITDWSSCTWLIDEQSEQMCAELYPEFFRLENEIRAFAGRVLTYKIGVDWIERFGLEKFNESAQNLAAIFQQRVPEFDNINADLISLTLESLFEMIFRGIIYKDETILVPDDFKTLNNILKAGKSDSIKKFLEKKRTVQYKIWDDIFVPYFDDAERFKTDVTKFINSRNHIVHNKLISFSAYNIIYNELDLIQEDLDLAKDKFEKDVLSKEMEDTRDALAEQEMEGYDERDYWRSRVADETGIDVLDEKQIYERFIGTLDDIHSCLLKHFQYDPCFTIEDIADAAIGNETVIFRVICNADEESFIEVRVSMIVDDDMGEESYMHIYCYKDEEKLYEATVTYINGDGSEDDEFRIQVDRDSEYNDDEIEVFTENLIDYIENELNPYICQIAAIAYESEGGESVVADFPCEVCGKNGVSKNADFYPVGFCCFCGVENDVKICALCETIYNEFGGNDSVCNECLSKEDIYKWQVMGKQLEKNL